jgi:hypothetical protein
MTLDFFMLADGANVAEGKIYIHGGGITRFHVPAFPSPMPQVAAVARFIIARDDIGRSQPITIGWRGPGDLGLLHEIRGDITAQDLGSLPNEEHGVVIVATFSGIPLERPGSYEARLTIIGDEDNYVARQVIAVHVPVSDQPPSLNQ